MFKSTIKLRFNHVLQDDPDGIYSVFYRDHFNTPNAQLITQGKTYQTNCVIIEVPNFPPGREIAFVAIGRETACYTETTKLIPPGPHTVWLIAAPEVNFSV